MSTLADELLQDFEDSGSENGEEQLDNDADAGLQIDGPVHRHHQYESADADMMLDGDEEEEPDQEDEVMGGTSAASALDTIQDEDAAKAQVEKMQLGSVKDIRKVTRLMDRLEPLLKVSLSLLLPSPPSLLPLPSSLQHINRLCSLLREEYKYLHRRH